MMAMLCVRAPTVPIAAAFGSTAAVALFHIAGITPEAPDVATALAHKEPEHTLELTAEDLAAAWRALDSCGEPEQPDRIELVAVGNPHLSLSVRALPTCLRALPACLPACLPTFVRGRPFTVSDSHLERRCPVL